MHHTAIAPARIRHPELPHLPLRLHHHAFVVRDQEVNPRFLEDVVGLPLAGWRENNTDRKPATAATI